MIKFFRTIRKSLLEQNKMEKYFKYAIGEIILVVIGILIALQINNWNEQQANEERIKSTLLQIQADLLNDIQELVTVLGFYEDTLTLIEQFLNKVKSKSYFEENFRALAQATLSYSPFSQSNQAFLRLKNQLDRIPEKYNPLIKNLNRLYVENGTKFSFSHNITSNEMFSYKSGLYDTYNWIEDYNNRNYTPEIKDFFLNSEKNRRQLVKTKATFREHARVVGLIHDQSISCYLLIRDILEDDSKLPDIFNRFGLKYTQNSIEELEGTYQHAEYPNIQLVLTARNDILRMTNPRSIQVNIESFILQEIGKDTLGLLASKQSYMVIKRNEKGKVTGYASVSQITEKEMVSFEKIK